MKTIFHHIERAKGKPHHVRRRLALGSAAGIAGFVGLVWFTHQAVTNGFAIQPNNFAETAHKSAAVVVYDPSTAAQVAAGAAALPARAPAHVEVVTADATSSAPSTPAKEETIIPF